MRAEKLTQHRFIIKTTLIVGIEFDTKRQRFSNIEGRALTYPIEIAIQ